MKNKKFNSELLEKVKLDYNTIAESFSDTRNKAWPEFDILLKKVQKHSLFSILNSPFSILDLACGNGRLYDFLSSQLSALSSQFSYTGIDNSEKLLNQAKKLHTKSPLDKGGWGDLSPTFTFGDILSIPAKDNHFDQVWCIAAFHHLPKELQNQGAKEILRVMEKNTILIITTWNLWQWKYLPQILKAFFKNPFKFQNLFIPWKKGENKVDRFYYAFTQNEFKKTFQKAGFEILENFKTKHNFCLICKKR